MSIRSIRTRMSARRHLGNRRQVLFDELSSPGYIYAAFFDDENMLTIVIFCTEELLVISPRQMYSFELISKQGLRLRLASGYVFMRIILATLWYL